MRGAGTEPPGRGGSRYQLLASRPHLTFHHPVAKASLFPFLTGLRLPSLCAGNQVRISVPRIPELQLCDSGIRVTQRAEGGLSRWAHKSTSNCRGSSDPP